MTTLLMWLSFTCGAVTDPTPYEMPRTQVIPLSNSTSGQQYELYIKLPENYNKDKDSTYPVIYFTDAVWHIEILSAVTDYLMEHVILVGVSWQKDLSDELLQQTGAHASRFRDYSARESSNPAHQAKYNFGQANNHLAFIRKDVIKYTEKNYRTKPADRTYFGYSMGGEFGSYALLTQPDTFNNYILGSPSLRQDDVAYFAALANELNIKHKNPNPQVFISYGTSEKEASVHIDAFIDLLKKQQGDHLSLTHEVLEGSHQSAFPLTAISAVNWLNKLTQSGE